MAKITVNNGKGREVNPFEYTQQQELEMEAHGHTHGQFQQDDKKRFEFEYNVRSYPAPSIPDTPPGEFVEAELVWQAGSTLGWIDVNNVYYERYDNDFYKFSADKKDVRQIYRLSTPPVKEVERSGVKTAKQVMADVWQLPDKFHHPLGEETILKFAKQYAKQVAEALYAEVIKRYSSVDEPSIHTIDITQFIK